MEQPCNTKWVHTLLVSDRHLPDDITMPPYNPGSPGPVDDALESGLTALRLIKEVSDVLPPLKSVAAAAVSITEIILQHRSNDREWKDFGNLIVDQINIVKNRAASCQRQDVDHSLQKAISTLENSLNKINDSIKGALSRGRLSKRLRAKEDAKKLADLKMEFKDAIMLFSMAIDLHISYPQLLNSNNRADLRDQTGGEIPGLPRYFRGREHYIKNLVSEMILCHAAKEPAHIAICGEAGLGKTTVVYGVMHDEKINELFGFRKYFVCCEASTNHALLLSALAASIRLTPTEGQDDLLFHIKKTLMKDDQPALLVLDNFETCWNSGSRYEIQKIINSLASAKNLTLILTMRGHHDLDEVSWTPIDPLDVLEPHDARQVFEVVAAKLFSESDGDILGRLLSEVGYLPLAIVLLARLVRKGESLPSLYGRWKTERTTLVSHGSRERHYNLDMSISFSINSRPMQEFAPALRLLSILACLPDGIPRSHLADITCMSQAEACHAATTLTDVGLTRFERDVLKAIPPIRSHVAHHHPAYVDDILSCRKYYCSLIGLAIKCDKTLEIRRVAGKLAPELGNICQMFYQWIDSKKDAEDAASSVLDLSKFLYLTPYRTDLVERVLQSKDFHISAAMKTALLHMHGMSSVVLCDYPTARRTLESARSLYKNMENKVGNVGCTWALGDMYRVQGCYLEAREYLYLALREYQELGSRYLANQAACFWSLGDTLDMLGECTEGSDLAYKARDIYLQLDNQTGATAATLLCAGIEIYRDNYEEARNILETTLEECRRTRDTSNLRNCLLQLGELYCFTREFKLAETHLNEGLKLYGEYGSKQGLADTYRFLGTASWLQGDHQEALSYFNRAQEIYSTLNHRLHTADILTSFGHLYVSEGNSQAAKPLFLEARRHYEDLSCRRGLAALEVLISRINAKEGNREDAITRLHNAAELYRHMGNVLRAEDCSSMAGNLDRDVPRWMTQAR